MESQNKPRLKAMCIFVHNGKTLASKGYDKGKDETFYRLIGGSIEYGETSEAGVRREIREELKSDVENLKLIKVVENIFTYEGKLGHEVVFVFTGDLADKGLYEKEKIHIVEPYSEFDAEWISNDEVLSEKIKLYPSFDYSEVFKL